MTTVFSNEKGVLFFNFTEPGIIITSEVYCKTLSKLCLTIQYQRRMLSHKLLSFTVKNMHTWLPTQLKQFKNCDGIIHLIVLISCPVTINSSYTSRTGFSMIWGNWRMENFSAKLAEIPGSRILYKWFEKACFMISEVFGGLCRKILYVCIFWNH